MKQLIIILIFMALLHTSYAQEKACQTNCESGWCWGDKAEKAKQYWTLLDDNIMLKNMVTAEASLAWLLTNASPLNKALYINGEKVYKALERNAKDKQTEELYQDKLIALYYQRIKYFGNEKFVKDKIGALADSFYVNRGGATYEEKRPHWEKIYNIYNDILRLNGNETKYYNVRYFMLSADKMSKLNKDTTALTEAYNRCESIFDYAIPRADERTKWEETKNRVQSIYEGSIHISCEYVKEKWIPQLKKDSSNIKLAKKAIRFMIQDKCTDDPYFDFLVELVYSQEEISRRRYITFGEKYKIKGDYEKAEQYYREAIKIASEEVANDSTLQAEYYMGIASIRAKQNKYSEARELYLKAVELDINQGPRAYTSIGDLYMRTASSCQPPEEESDPITTKAPYLAAYEMYEKAGNKNKMKLAKSAFPTKVEIFTWLPTDTRETSVKVYGWIGGIATIRAR